jgi:hypothetical protein
VTWATARNMNDAACRVSVTSGYQCVLFACMVGSVTKKCGKMDLETEASAKEAYEMQLYGFSSRTVCDCGNSAYNVLSLLGGFRSRIGYVTDIKSVIQQVTQFPYLF